VKYSEIRHRHKVLFATLGALTLLSIGIVIGFVVLLSGAMSTAATTQHFGITHRLLELGLRFSVNAAASGIEAPALDDPVLIDVGLGCFREHCEQCHGAPAVPPMAAARGLLPTPNSLAESAREWSPAALYYITRKGVRMTGMPAWEFRISETGLWSTVAFLRTLPSLTRAEYQALGSAPAPPCPRQPGANAAASFEDADVLLRQYACHSCHRIEGVVGPDTYLGPPLEDWPQRKYIAGTLPNTEANLILWLTEPSAVSPHTLMPDLEVTPGHARAIARWLLSQD
jgi:mono/diheme cytochrome c family protein